MSFNRTAAILTALLMAGCMTKKNRVPMREIQLTHGSHGHMLNGRQVFSPDGDWVVYDTRNDDTHISRTCCIEKVNIHTGEVRSLYSTTGQNEYGPGVGAAAWHPNEEKIIFIHGLLNCNVNQPYHFTRRFGAIWNADKPSGIIPAEARTISVPLKPGALRGGTHAHSWSGDGEWISFTYNDFLIEQLEKDGKGVRDLRTVGVMAPIGAVTVEAEDAENFSGAYFSVIAGTVTEDPVNGSDEIEKAFDECWVGESGYRRQDGKRQLRALAFQGNVRTDEGDVITEVFIADLPENISIARDHPLEGTLTSRPSVPAGHTQRRLTFTNARKYPGIQGPRFWLRSSPDGKFIFFLMKDDTGLVQIYSATVNEGEIRQVTDLDVSVASQFNVCPEGRRLAYIADNSVWITDIASGGSTRLTVRRNDSDAPVGAVSWSPGGNTLVYNRYVSSPSERYLQIFRIDLE